ncbi:MAG TPA: hypothetical protein VGD73_20870 [Pseudonocardia sp.]|uniref:hypothetical protein n=1 Tax=Pseudonocardia sp. TaxID=60912 RepID=UPI002EDA34FC
MTEILRELRVFWIDGRRIERVAYLVGAVLLLSGLAHLGVQAIAGGPWEGPVSWRKPTTFGLSFGLTVISVTWVASFLRMPERLRLALLGGFLLASVAEVGLITAQAWRRVPSHFNFETSFDTGVSMVLAAGGGVLFVVLGALFAQSLKPQPGLDPELRLGIRLGLGALLAGLVIGGIMIGIGTTMARGGDPRGAYHGAGVFKLAHAVGLHGIAVLPGLAWLSGVGGQTRSGLGGQALSGLGGRPTPRRTVLRTGTVGYLGLLGCAMLVGAQGRLTILSVLGLAVAGLVLISALLQAFAAARVARPAGAGVPVR